MNCLLVAATAIEIAPFLEWYRDPGSKLRMETDVLITGIGLTAATYALTRQISLRKPGLVIQAGVAGCFDTRIPLGRVLAVKQDTIADQSVVELQQLKTLFDLKLVPADQFPYRKGWLRNDTEALKSTRLRKVKAISVNEISTNPQKIRFYREKFNPVLESMEGAALHYVCLRENVPFLQLRSVSNYIGERNKKKWDMKTSVANLNRELLQLFSA